MKNKGTREELIERMNIVVDAMEKKLALKRDLEAEKINLLNGMKFIEIKTQQEVSNAVVDGKKVYTNTETRAAAEFEKLDNNVEYGNIKKRMNEVTGELMETNDGLEILKYKFRICQGTIELLKIEND
jgi:hypothetical protein